MDESEATRRVKELASLLKKGSWHYFVTVTCNDAFTPGVRMITRAIRQIATCEKEVEKLTMNYLTYILRAWERFVKLLFEELLMRNHTILGHVKHLFYRFEFQSAGAKGNKPHVHCGMTLESEPEWVTASRISCDSVTFQSRACGGDFDTLKNAGVFKDLVDYNAWLDVVSCVQHHDCSMTENRCKKATDANGNKVCRYHRQPRPPQCETMAWFEQMELPYGEDAYKLLEEMGLARRVEENWVMDK